MSRTYRKHKAVETKPKRTDKRTTLKSHKQLRTNNRKNLRKEYM